MMKITTPFRMPKAYTYQVLIHDLYDESKVKHEFQCLTTEDIQMKLTNLGIKITLRSVFNILKDDLTKRSRFRHIKIIRSLELQVNPKKKIPIKLKSDTEKFDEKKIFLINDQV